MVLNHGPEYRFISCSAPYPTPELTGDSILLSSVHFDWGGTRARIIF